MGQEKLTIYKFEETGKKNNSFGLQKLKIMKNAEDKIASYDKFEESNSLQLSLFSLLEEETNEYSRTLELYDAVPKFMVGRPERTAGKFLDLFKNKFQYRDMNYHVTVRPAKLELGKIDNGKVGDTKDFYPGKKEEVIEDALRKLAINKNCVLLNEQAAFPFTIYELQQELMQYGHTYSYDQIKESLFILTYTQIELTMEEGSYSWNFSPIETLGIDKDNSEKIIFIRFSKLLTESINSGKFRKFNYKKLMSLKKYISKRIFKRLSHLYTQASISDKYEIHASRLIQDFGIPKYSSIRDNFRKIESSLKELVENEVLLNYSYKTIYSKERSNKIEDYKISLQPSPQFVSDIISANKEAKENRKLIMEGGTETVAE